MTALLPLAIVAALLLYFLPSIIAFSRKVPNSGSVLVINLLLGWSLIGWAIALAMAARSTTQRQVAPGALPASQPGVPQEPSGLRPCPFCAEDIKAAAVVCRFCGREVEAVVLAPVQAEAVGGNGPDWSSAAQDPLTESLGLPQSLKVLGAGQTVLVAAALSAFGWLAYIIAYHPSDLLRSFFVYPIIGLALSAAAAGVCLNSAKSQMRSSVPKTSLILAAASALNVVLAGVGSHFFPIILRFYAFGALAWITVGLLIAIGVWLVASIRWFRADGGS